MYLLAFLWEGLILRASAKSLMALDKLFWFANLKLKYIRIKLVNLFLIIMRFDPLKPLRGQ